MEINLTQLEGTRYEEMIPEIIAQIEKSDTLYSKKSMISQIYNVEDIDSYVADYGNISVTPKEEGCKPVIVEGYRKIIEPREYTGEFDIKPGDTIQKVLGLAKSLVLSAYRTKEVIAALPFNYCNQVAITYFDTSISISGADGQPFASHLHPSITANTVQSNVSYDSLTLDSLCQSIDAMVDFKDHDGHLMGCEPTALLIPRHYDIVELAKKLINVLRSKGTKLELITWPFYAAGEAWGKEPWALLDTSAIQNNCDLMFVNRLSLQIRALYDKDTDVATIEGRQRFAPGVVDWRCAFFNLP